MPSPFCTLAKFIQFRFAPETVTLRNHHRFEDDGCVFQLQDVLTQNQALLNGGIVADLAQAVGVGKEVALYLYVMGLPGVCVVIGTKNPTHMKEDFEGYEKWQNWVDDVANEEKNWDWYMARFKHFWAVTHPYGPR